MKRFLVLAAISVFPAVAQADWVKVNEYTSEGTTPEQIKDILDRENDFMLGHFRRQLVNAQLAGLKPAVITALSTKLEIFQYSGKTTCPVADPRLTLELSSGDATFSDNTGEGWATAYPVGDPCSDSFKAPKLISKK
ncbi:MAG: hypothetical protein AB7T49_14425 [Oligoflexales bacterium]